MKMTEKQRRRGIFITFEGPEGAGKSTQIRLLEAYFHERSLPVIVSREPGGTVLAEKIRELVKTFHHPEESMSPRTELLLMEAARSQHAAVKIGPALADGICVLCDRYYDSTAAYQGAGRGIAAEDVAFLNSFAAAECRPDLTILLDLAPERGFERTRKRQSTLGEPDRFEEEGLRFHRQVREAFLKIAQREPDRVRIVNADDTPERVQAEIREIVNEFI